MFPFQYKKKIMILYIMVIYLHETNNSWDLFSASLNTIYTVSALSPLHAACLSQQSLGVL